MLVPAPTSAASRRSLENTETYRLWNAQRRRIGLTRQTDLLHRHVGQEGYNVTRHGNDQTRLVGILPRHHFDVVSGLESLPDTPRRYLNLLSFEIERADRVHGHNIQVDGLDNTVNTRLFTFEHLNMVAGLQHCYCSLPRSFGDKGKVNGVLHALAFVTSPRKSRDLV